MVKSIVRYHTSDLNRRAQVKVPVDTGFLKRSIRLSIEGGGLTGKVTAHADYAGYVEKGTRFMRAQPYMEPALNEVKEGFIADLERMEGRS